MTKALRILLAIFTVYRLASLVSSEEGPSFGLTPNGRGIFDWIRMKLGAYDHGPDGLPETNLGRGISCPLCTGVYISGVVAAILEPPHRRPWDFFLTWFGLAGAQVFLENLTSDDAIKDAIEDVAENMEN